MEKLLQMLRAILLLVVFLTACNPVTSVPMPTQVPPPTLMLSTTPTFAPSLTPLSEVQQYLSDALDIIQNNALNSNEIDWPKVRQIAFMFENNAKTPADTYDSISFVLRQLSDHHSFLVTPEEANQSRNSTVEDYPAPTGKLIENKIGYVEVFGFNSPSEDEMNKYADMIQHIIIELDNQSACGWIVDLRENDGGNMYPMIAGLGALVGEGELGSFKDSTGQTTSWYYLDGHAGEENIPYVTVSHPELLFDPNKTPVAVLISAQTASSGEATAISFRGRENTRFFGQASAGFTKGNEVFDLSDGALIVLSTTVELDRTGQEYGGKILPDVVTANPEVDASDWLLAQPACQK